MLIGLLSIRRMYSHLSDTSSFDKCQLGWQCSSYVCIFMPCIDLDDLDFQSCCQINITELMNSS